MQVRYADGERERLGMDFAFRFCYKAIRMYFCVSDVIALVYFNQIKQKVLCVSDLHIGLV